MSGRATLRGRLAAAANLREGEAPLVAWLLVHSFFNGFPKTLTNSAGSALFLEQHGARLLPFAYIASAVVVTLIGVGFLKLGRVLGFATRLQAVLAVVIAGELLLRLGIAVLGVRPVSALLPVWSEIEWSILPLAYWSLASQVFNLQQGKRIFTLLGIGELVSSTLLGFLLPAIVSVVGAANVLLLSALGAIGSLWALRRVVQLAGARLAAAGEEAPGQAAPGPRAEGAERYRRYSWKLFALIACSFLSAYFMDNVFSDRAEARLKDADRLAAFLGVFWGACNLGALVFKSGLAGRLLARYGLALGLSALPILLFAGFGSVAVLGTALGAGALVFWILVVARALDYLTRDALDGPSGMILYQPLPPGVRAAVQARAEGIVGPLAGGLSGVLLAVLTHAFHFGAVQNAAVAALVACVWLAVATALRKDYRGMLEAALAGRRLQGLTLSRDDPATLRVLERGLHSARPGEVFYSLQLLEELEARSLEPALRGLLGHAEAAVRAQALVRLERRGSTAALGAVAPLLERDPAPEVRGAAARALASLGSEAELERAVALLDHPEREVRDGALVGLLRSGAVAGIVAAGQRLTALARSPLAAERAQAARLLAEIELPGFHQVLEPLLRDPQLAVRRRALAAAERLGSPRLWPAIAGSLVLPAVRAPAERALAAGGAQALPLLEQLLEKQAAPPGLRASAASICGRIGGAQASALLLRFLGGAVRSERRAALAALAACGWQAAAGAERERVLALLDGELRAARETLAARLELGEEAPGGGPGEAGLLGRALAIETEAARERVLLLLSFLHPPGALQRVRSAFARASEDERALAVELAAGVLDQQLRERALPLFEDAPPAELLEALPGPGAGPLPPADRLVLLARGDDPIRSTWTALCARHQLRRQRRPEDPLPEEDPMLTVEKVMILRSVSIFAETPDDVLAEIAALLREEQLQAGRTVFEKGATGDCLYVIGDGRIRIHDGERTLAQLGERDIFGELALLDAEPRSASATAEVETRLFRVDQDAFYDLMADRIEVVRGILRVLCRRLRVRNQASAPAAG